MVWDNKWFKCGHIWGIWAYGHMGICEKIWSSGVSPKRPSKMQLRNVNLRSVGKKMPCILHGVTKKIRDVFSSQVSGRAQLSGVIIYIVDHFGNYFISGGHTCIICTHPTRYKVVKRKVLWHFVGFLEVVKSSSVAVIPPSSADILTPKRPPGPCFQIEKPPSHGAVMIKMIFTMRKFQCLRKYFQLRLYFIRHQK